MRASQNHEDKCKRCGKCCLVKYLVGGVVFNSRNYCRHYDRRARGCKVYKRRRKVNPQCVDVATGMKLGIFPADCGYIENPAAYAPPYPIPLDAETERLLADGAFVTPDEVIATLRKQQKR